MIDFLNPWVGEITELSEEAEDALEHLFKDVWEKHGTLKAIWFAFCVGQAFERAMTQQT